MRRICEALALVGIVVAVAGLYGGLAAAERSVGGDAGREFEIIAAALHDRGLLRRIDVSIEIDASPVAAGFSRLDCDGLLLVAPVPRTAQGWEHVAPRLDLSEFTLRYAYDGNLHRSVPTLQRLAQRLAAELRPLTSSRRPSVLAVAEAGDCNLMASALAVLEDYSRGHATTAGRAARQLAFRG